MPRRYDADLCRLRGWTPGDLILFSSTTDGHAMNVYLLTGVGRRSVLMSLVVPEHLGGGKFSTRLEPDSKELMHSGSLHQFVLTKVGRCESWLSESQEPVEQETLLTEWPDEAAC